METERDREDTDEGSQIGYNVIQSIDILADIQISQNDLKVDITADGNDIWIRSNARTLLRLMRVIPSGRLPVGSLHRMLQRMGLTLKYRRKYFSLSLLGSKANRWVVSLLSFWLR
jgi:hypothetical protein